MTDIKHGTKKGPNKNITVKIHTYIYIYTLFVPRGIFRIKVLVNKTNIHYDLRVNKKVNYHLSSLKINFEMFVIKKMFLLMLLCF